MPKLRRVDVASLKNQSGDPQNIHIRYLRRSCRRSLLQINLKRSQMSPQYDTCRDLSRTGPLFSTVFFQMGKSVSTNAAKSQSQTSRVPNVWPCHWLSKRRAKTKQVTSQSWAPVDAHSGRASFVADQQSTDAVQRTSVDGRSPHHCLHATGQAFHWRRLAQSGTRGLPNVWGRIQTGLVGVACLQTGSFGVALPLKIQD